MITQSGTYCWPERGAPTLADIGWGIYRIPRFAGQTLKWYSVGAHSEVVAGLVPDEVKIHALLHDAPECVVSDTPTTWKTEIHQRSEALIMRRIYRNLGLKMPTKAEKKIVKKADMRALYAEALILGHAEADYWGVDPDEEAIRLTRYAYDNQISIHEPEKASDRYIKLVNKCYQLRSIKKSAEQST